MLIGDGAMGTMLQAVDLTVDGDFLGLEGCNEILNATRPDVVENIHRAFFEAGADPNGGVPTAIDTARMFEKDAFLELFGV